MTMSTDAVQNDTSDSFPSNSHDDPQHNTYEQPSYDRYSVESRDSNATPQPLHSRRCHDTKTGVEAPRRPSDKNVNIDKFDGKLGEWDLIHQFEFIAETYPGKVYLAPEDNYS